MSLLQQVQRGRSHLPPRILVYGTEGVGKSSLAATTPKPIFIQTEDGLGEIDCDKFPLAKSLEDVVAALTELETQQHDYQTVAIDSLDWLERLIWDAVCRRESAQNTRHAPQLGNLGCLGVLTQPQTGDPNKEKIRRKDQTVPFGIKLGRHGKFQAARRRSEV